MSEVIKGSVWDIRERKWGQKTMYSIKLDNGTLYGTGDVKPAANKGDLVKFEAEKNDKGYWNIKNPKSIKVAAGKGTPPPAGGSAGNGGGGYSKGGVRGNDATQAAIIVQNACTAATSLIVAALDKEAIALPAKKADRLDALLDAHHRITEELFKYNLGVYVKVDAGTKLSDLVIADLTEATEEEAEELVDPDFADVADAEEADGDFEDDPDFE